MSAWWLIVFVVVTASTFVNSKFDLDTPVQAARCRASCLYKMQISSATDLECRRSFNCSQCWEACAAVKARSTLCAPTDCGPGCLESCRLLSSMPVEEALVLDDSRVSWPTVSSPVVYVVMVDGSQLSQTLESIVTLPSAVDPATVRVLVVDWRGLVKVFGPVAESPVDQTLKVLRSLGMEDQLGLGLRANSPFDEGLSVNSLIPKFLQVIFQRAWRLKVESVHHQPPLVLGKISWRYYHHQLLKANQLTSYLVTWSVDSGMIRGNLLTNTSTVTLSLLPDTVYRIQVSMLNRRGSTLHSEFLVLDTHLFHSKPSNISSTLRRDFELSDTRPIAPGQRHETETATAMVLIFLGLIVASAWRWRYCNVSPKRKSLSDRIDYRLYRDMPSSRSIFQKSYPIKELSSTENLLQTSYNRE